MNIDCAQKEPEGVNLTWPSVGIGNREIATGIGADGRILAVKIGQDNALWHRVQHEDGAWGEWSSLGGWVRQFAIRTDEHGEVLVFAIGSDGDLWSLSQGADGTWSSWGSLGGWLSQLALGQDAKGLLTVYGVGSGRTLYSRTKQADGSWGRWTRLHRVRGAAALENIPEGLLESLETKAGRVVDEVPETVIDDQRRWWQFNLKEIWARRELLYFLVRRDIKVRYSRTFFGAAWALFQPALFTVIFTIFFPHKSDAELIPYPIYVFSGFLAWTLFASTVSGVGNSVVTAENLISKVYMPRLMIPLAAVGVHLVDFLVASAGMAVLMMCYRIPPGWNLLYFPLCAALIGLAGFGVGTLFAALNVKYRDFRYVVPFVIQAWMFSTPTIFSQEVKAPAASIFGSQEFFKLVHDLLRQLNPMSGLIGLFRASLLGGEISGQQIGLSVLVILVFVTAGCLYFRRVEDSFADII